jgi:mitogen-activated protein kinase kinase 1
MGEKGQRHQVLNELRVLCALEHACLVPLFDAFYLDGNVYLALGYMDGGSLEQLLRGYRQVAAAARLSTSGLPDEPLAHVLMQVLCGLDYLHQKGVVHRDLKPANILLDTRGAVRVSDFGISKQLEQTFGDFAKSFVGTAAYMAPERISGQNYTTAADIWGVGMIAYECALGEHPYQHAQSYYDLVVALSEGATPPRLPADRFSPQLCEFVSATLVPAPEGRPRSTDLLVQRFLATHHVCFGSTAPSPQQLSALAAAKLGEWVRQQFPQAAAASAGTACGAVRATAEAVQSLQGSVGGATSMSTD